MDSAWEHKKLEATRSEMLDAKRGDHSLDALLGVFVAPDLLAEKNDKNLTRFLLGNCTFLEFSKPTKVFTNKKSDSTLYE